jgi:hypothetical protein
MVMKKPQVQFHVHLYAPKLHTRPVVKRPRYAESPITQVTDPPSQP